MFREKVHWKLPISRQLKVEKLFFIVWDVLLQQAAKVTFKPCTRGICRGGRFLVLLGGQRTDNALTPVAESFRGKGAME